MAYNEIEARDLVIKAGHELIDKKLIARTWGNISARISDTEFVITPSGRSYEDLKPEELVRVRISDCSYEGEIKPSSEKGIHADAYGIRPDVAFVIHTHQLYATAVSVEGEDTEFALCAGYGLPGTKSLRKKVTAAIKKDTSKNAILMQRHGVLCFGTSYEDAFNNADRLEERSKQLYHASICNKSEKAMSKPWVDDYAQMFGYGVRPVDEDEEAVRLLKEKNRAAAAFARLAKPMSVPDVMLQHLVFRFKYSKLK